MHDGTEDQGIVEAFAEHDSHDMRLSRMNELICFRFPVISSHGLL